MTLVVAGVVGEMGWMVSDTLISGGPIQLRDREYQIKCMPAKDRRALISFSGDAHHGGKFIERAAEMQSGEGVVSALCKAQREHSNIDFLYMFLDKADRPHLYKLSAGHASEVAATFIGDKDAFEQFQSIRHATEISPVPKAVEQFMIGARTPDSLPRAVGNITVSMLRLFMQRAERDVGGWAMAYVLVPQGACMCGYAHSVSDPILDKVAPGALVPHGTAESGGYGLSVAEFGDLEGIVVYYRQIPGGIVLVREAAGYRSIFIEGAPSEFCTKANALLGQPVEIFFGDAPLGTPESITILRDAAGQPAMAVAMRGNNLSFSVLNVSTVFAATGVLDLPAEKKGPKPVVVQNLTLTLAEDRSHVVLKLMNDGEVAGESTLNASELDTVINGLGRLRAALTEQVRPEPDQSGGSSEFLIVDPAWRTDVAPHPDLNGVIMRLRHIGLGWVSFLLPHHEGRNLGKWLTDSCGGHESDTATH